MVKYYKKPPTFEAEQFDGTEESADRVIGLARSYNHYALEETWSKNTSISVFRETHYNNKKNAKNVSVYVGNWFVIAQNGKYKVLIDEDFRDEYGVIDE